ncbi:MAG: tripartite tricarboxylate transporter TctB family protein, partial [Actinomycetia bacterium]|nr:tripartite tricarboxylate transporter TctB family protein [Actinomycetes bacterium]
DDTSDAQAPSDEVPGDDEGAPVEEAISWPRIAGVLLASLAVPLLADTTGFVVTLSAAVVAIAKIMGMPGWLKPVLLGVAFGVTSWLVFVYWLFVPLPAGSLGLV